ncbi:MAG TPA: DUF362 domain-containing protein, partial [Armatimonadota bacterium]|nr:DUF362 domain-containing protein [Armatimonadota bacterium]
MAERSLNRRELLVGAGAAAGLAALGGSLSLPAAAAKNPSSPVALGRCETYELATVLKQLDTMLNGIGGLKRLVAGKTVAVKVNLTGDPTQKAVGLPAARTYQTHPNVVLATAILLDRAGAKRIRFLEGTYQHGTMEQFLRTAGWDLAALDALRATVEYEDTRNKGKGKDYHQVKVPWGGSLFPAYHLNHSYVDCDVYLSLAKLKNHVNAGVTLAIKNNFGVTPVALYGQHQPDENSTSNRGKLFHSGEERPAAGLPQELAPGSPRRATYRVPRHTVDSIGIRPIDLAIIDGIETVSGGEGPWIGSLAYQKPNLLIAGRNAVCTDAIGTAAMGYDPMAKSGTGP